MKKNIIPTVRITPRAIRTFRKKKSGRIINIISSAVINKPPIGWAAYMSKSWATEGIKFNISSNCISPSFMQTNLTNDVDERIVENMTQEHPLKKLLTTEEVADAVLFLCNALPKSMVLTLQSMPALIYCSKRIDGINWIAL